MRTDMVTNKGLTVGLKELKVRADLVGRMYAVPQSRGRYSKGTVTPELSLEWGAAWGPRSVNVKDLVILLGVRR